MAGGWHTGDAVRGALDLKDAVKGIRHWQCHKGQGVLPGVDREGRAGVLRAGRSGGRAKAAGDAIHG